MRLKEYYCSSPDSKKDEINPQGCLYEGNWDSDKNCIFCHKSFDETRTVWYSMYRKLPYWAKRLLNRPDRQIARQVRWFFQRRKRGFDDTELWSLDLTIAEFIEPRLREFKRRLNGYPCGMEEQEWLEKLEKMHRAFHLIVKEDGKMMLPNSPEAKEIEEGLDLFREHFFHLWN